VSTIRGQRVGFGATYGLEPFDPARLADDARRAEALGYDLFCLSDHLNTSHPTLETWTALTWAAAATERIEVMTNVLGLPYRHPAVTAKMAETLDRLSGGRLVLGLGTGGYDREFSAFGLAERTPGQKVAALGEALEIVRGLWREPDVSFSGDHFHLDGARIEPRPSHHIPIWLGSYGPRALRLTGRTADGWIPSLTRVSLDEAVAMRDTVLDAARAAGRDPDEITCAANIVVAFGGPDPPPPAEITGGAEAIAERVTAIVEAGFTFVNAMFRDAEARERFAIEVIPLVRQATAR
jgi:probable F420-dependent oxidoreductase